MKRGKLIVISGPSGVGKTTVVTRLLERMSLARSVSATTRPPRPGEREGKDYYFLTPEAFERKAAEGGFLEHAGILGRRYGTPKEPVEAALAGGKSIVMAIDVQGAEQVLEKAPDAVSIFLAPPSRGALEERLRGRSTESEAQIRDRLRLAGEELAKKERYKHVVVNDDLERTVREIEGILRAELN